MKLQESDPILAEQIATSQVALALPLALLSLIIGALSVAAKHPPFDGATENYTSLAAILDTVWREGAQKAHTVLTTPPTQTDLAVLAGIQPNNKLN